MRCATLLAVLALTLAPAMAAPTLGVTGVAARDTLSLRAAPDAKSARTGTLPPDATGIAVVAVDSKGTDWVKIAKGSVSGWVNAKFLIYSESGAPVRLTCSGAEPYWSLAVGYGVAVFDKDGKVSKIALDAPQAPQARPDTWLYAVHGKPGAFLLAARPQTKCSNDTEAEYAYSIAVHAGNAFVLGCCN